MIQIDDAGSGSFVGGTCIGVYRPETNEYFFDIIPVELYNKENFKNKYYLDEVVNIVANAFKAMNVHKTETIEICRGYMFEKLRKWLDNQGFCWYSTQICGRIQDVVEKNYMLYTVRLGVPEAYIQYTKYPFHFHKLLRWVYADFDNRIGICKTGWKSWSKYENIIPELSHDIMKQSNIFCLKCGKRIKKGSKTSVLNFTSNRDQYIYLHEKCQLT
ncbi:hypothetical protein [Acetivibrio cellulolyticus]|uniref:hypothetical protein n=1 Tax=Acetivibrio cellulolyticus TaxID=35830 RepID=UPI0001E2F134|nr:hypothetical protein [Acetivibrio cellulolyticus]